MNIFHIHTYRCGHAEEIPDERYVEKAIELGASDIWFTEHAPFPGDPFNFHMAYADLEEYFRTLSGLKQKYRDINVHIGLETEYFPLYDAMGYYQKLRSIPELEILLLGQHMAAISDSPPVYSFSESEEFQTENEYKLLGQAIVQGVRSGYFNVIAHPDRIFRRRSVWEPAMEEVASAIIQAAIAADIPLEMNLASVEHPENYKPQFWKLVPDTAKRIVGLDAHAIHEMVTRHQEREERLKKYEA